MQAVRGLDFLCGAPEPTGRSSLFPSLSLLSKRKRESDTFSPLTSGEKSVLLESKGRTFLFLFLLGSKGTFLVTFSCVCSRESNQREERPVGSGAPAQKIQSASGLNFLRCAPLPPPPALRESGGSVPWFSKGKVKPHRKWVVRRAFGSARTAARAVKLPERRRKGTGEHCPNTEKICINKNYF